MSVLLIMVIGIVGLLLTSVVRARRSAEIFSSRTTIRVLACPESGRSAIVAIRDGFRVNECSLHTQCRFSCLKRIEPTAMQQGESHAHSKAEGIPG